MLLLITTNGTPGSVGALPTYPIPDGSSAALLVSNHTLFNGLLPSQLSSRGSVINADADGSCGTDGVWRTTIQSGTANVGAIEIGAPDDGPYSSNGEEYPTWWSRFWHNGHTQERAVSVPLSGLTVGPSSSGLSATHSARWQQGWDYTTTTWWGRIRHRGHLRPGGDHPDLPGQRDTRRRPDDLPGHLSLDRSARLRLASRTTYQWGLFKTDPGVAIASQVVARMTLVFQALTLAEVNTFALQNLLFYGQNALRLSAGSVPADLVLTGSLSPMLAVDPVSVDVIAGGPPVHFTATLGGKPGFRPVVATGSTVGHIDADGGYTAPPQVVARTAGSGDGHRRQRQRTGAAGGDATTRGRPRGAARPRIAAAGRAAVP